MTRLLLLVALGCAAPDAPCVSSPLPTGPEDPFRILWAGDTLLGDAARPMLEARGYDAAFERVLPLLGGVDLRILNLEGPITDRHEPRDPEQRWSYDASPASAKAIARAGFHAASLANNHGMDRDAAGLLDTVAHLRDAGVQPFGGGPDLSSARAPFVVGTPHGRVAVFGFYAQAKPDVVARPFLPGIVPANATEIDAALRTAERIGAEHTVAFVHWGWNYADVNRQQRVLARRFAEAGFDLVVGHGAHVPQPAERLCGATVFHSLGNFVFGTPGRFSREFPGFGLVLVSELGPDGFSGFEVRCARTDNRRVHYRPGPCTEEEARAAAAALHPDVTFVDGVGRWTADLAADPRGG